MSLGYIWWNSVRADGSVSGSWQVATSPAPVVYAFSSMQSLETAIWGGAYTNPDGWQDIAVYSGVGSFVQGGINVPVGNGQKYGVVPGIWNGDVTAVTFRWGITVPNDVSIPGGWQDVADYGHVDFTFQVFGWE